MSIYTTFLLETFRSLDAALDEHKAKGTKPGEPVYAKIFDQLAADVASAGFGKDDIAQVAYHVGQLSTYNRLRSLMPKQLGSDEQEAITHLQNQIDALAQIRANAEQAHANSPQFIGWRADTIELMRHFISANSEHLKRYLGLSFRSNIMLPDYPGVRQSGPRRDDIEKFATDSDVAVVCLQGAIRQIKVFGLKRDEPAAAAKPARSGSRSEITQYISGPVNQAIATGRATQNVEQIGAAGTSLAEIVELLQHSYELTRRQMEQAFGVAEQLEAEVKKPEGSRNWKSIANWGTTLLDLAGKATDLTERLAPHLPWLTHLITQARHQG